MRQYIYNSLSNITIGENMVELTRVEKFAILNNNSPFESAKRLYYYHKKKLGDELDKQIDVEFSKYLESVKVDGVNLDELVKKVNDYLERLGIRYNESSVRERVNEILSMKIVRFTRNNTMLDFAIIKTLMEEGKLKKVKRGLYIWG
jgi:hypothetical protein